MRSPLTREQVEALRADAEVARGAAIGVGVGAGGPRAPVLTVGVHPAWLMELCEAWQELDSRGDVGTLEVRRGK